MEVEHEELHHFFVNAQIYMNVNNDEVFLLINSVWMIS